jgi:peptide/nickel transport system ATP-binding protein
MREDREASPLLEIRGLKTYFATDDGMVQAVDGVDLTIGRGETLGVVGESGCGKTVTALSVLKLIAMPPGQIVAGQILYQGRDLAPLDTQEMDRIRAKDIAMVFQEPMTSLNPVYTIGEQIAEVLRRHEGLSRKIALDKTIEMLRLVQIPNAEKRYNDYPHQFSGGMRQRVMIRDGALLQTETADRRRADHGTRRHHSGADLELLQDMKSRFGMAIMLITHAMGVVAETAQRVVVMYAGKVIEEAPVEQLFANPRHPYTQGLIRSIPRIDTAATRKERLEAIPGVVPNLLNPPPGCRFAPRCLLCNAEMPRGGAAPVQRRPWTPCRLRARPRTNWWPRNDRAAAARQRPDQEFFRWRRLSRARRGRRSCGRSCQLRDRAGRDARAGRRIRLRQVDHRPLHPAADRADLGRNLVRGARRHRPRCRCVQLALPRHADHLPGPVRLAQPAHDRRRDHRRGAHHP